MIRADPSLSVVPDGPTILYGNELLNGTLTFGSESIDGYAANALDTFTYDFWTPASLPSFLLSTAAAARPVDCLGLVAHTLGSKGCSVRMMRDALARTNKHLYSENFSATGWTVSAPVDVALTANAARAPSGTISAGLLQCLTISNVTRRTYASANITVTPSASHYVQIYIKAKNWTWVGVNFAAGTSFSESAALGQINLTTGQVASQSGAFTVTKLDDGWWKIGAIGMTGPSTGYRLSVSLLSGAGSASASAVGSVGAGVYLFGAHVEQAATAGSYIKAGASTATSTTTAMTEYVIPPDDAPFILMTNPAIALGVGIEIDGPSSPSIGVAFAGQSLQLPCGVAPSYTPIYLSRVIDMETSRTRTGQFLGNRILRRGAAGRMQMTMMPSDYVQGPMMPFVDHYDEANAFFLASSPAMFPPDVAYAWRSDRADTMRPTFDDAGSFMSVGLEIEALVE